MISDELKREVDRVLELWLEQYAIGIDSDRERRPEIQATRALLERLNEEAVEVRHQIQLSTTEGKSWTDSPMPAFAELADAQQQVKTAPPTIWMHYAVQPVIYRGGEPLRYKRAIVQTIEDFARANGGQVHWPTGKEFHVSPKETTRPRLFHSQLKARLVELGFRRIGESTSNYAHLEEAVRANLEDYDRRAVFTLGWEG